MSIGVRRAVIGLAIGILAAATTISGPAFAHPEPESDGGLHVSDGPRDAHQHGDNAGHLPGSSKNVDLISKLKLKNVVPEKIADVGVLGNYAYLGAWGVVTCEYNGVHVVDISDVKNPSEVAFIPAQRGSYPGEGVQALRIDTPHFNGDLLVTNNEKCDPNTGFGGMNLYDVSDPKRPAILAEGVGDFSANGQNKMAANETHSVFAWDAGDKAYAVLVDNKEGKDVDIVDITNPRKAFLTAEYDLDEVFPQIKQAAPENLTEIFNHDMVVKEIGGRQVMLVSYWDGGYVKIDVTDVHNPIYLGDTDFTNPDPEAAESGYTVRPEGNAHQAEFTVDNKYVVASDEDFAPYALVAKNTTDGTNIDASQGSNTKKLEPGTTVAGQAVFFGRGCNGDPAAGAGDGTQIAVVERGACTFTEKVTNVIAKGGYKAVLIFNRTGSDACDATLGMLVEGDIPTFGVAPRGQGFAIFNTPYDNAACLAGDGTQLAPIALGAKGDSLSFSSYFDGWGYVHLYENGNGKMKELDTYAIPQAHDPAYSNGFGDLSVHEVATSGKFANRMYFSYYSGGLRVAEISRNKKIVETGHYIDAHGSNLWGVQVFEKGGQEYVAASDRDSGLWIFKYNPTK